MSSAPMTIMKPPASDSTDASTIARQGTRRSLGAGSEN